MIKIYTFSHKRPDFIELQNKSFMKNVKCDYEFIIFNNANFDIDKRQYNEIKNICKNNNLQCIDIEKDLDLIVELERLESMPIFHGDKTYVNANIACAYPLCWAWENIISKSNDMVCFIDSDMFLIEEENMIDICNKYNLCYVPQYRGENNKIYYMWNGLIFINIKNIPDKENFNLWCGRCDGIPVDVGGQTHYYLQNYKSQLNILEIGYQNIWEDPACNFSPANYDILSLEGRKSVLHYRSGSNWNNMPQDYHSKKSAWLNEKLK